MLQKSKVKVHPPCIHFKPSPRPQNAPTTLQKDRQTGAADRPRQECNRHARSLDMSGPTHSKKVGQATPVLAAETPQSCSGLQNLAGRLTSSPQAQTCPQTAAAAQLMRAGPLRSSSPCVAIQQHMSCTLHSPQMTCAAICRDRTRLFCPAFCLASRACSLEAAQMQQNFRPLHIMPSIPVPYALFCFAAKAVHEKAVKVHDQCPPKHKCMVQHGPHSSLRQAGRHAFRPRARSGARCFRSLRARRGLGQRGAKVQRVHRAPIRQRQAGKLAPLGHVRALREVVVPVALNGVQDLPAR